nr:MAG TPA: hypothetical protein [Caudoviricetes sp.]
MLMTYPVDEPVFIAQWLSVINNADETDKEFATATVQAINRAYYAGLKDGKEEAAVCRD